MCTNTVCDNQNTYSQKNLWLVTNFFQFFQTAVCEPIRAQTEKTFFLLSFPLFSRYFIFVGAVQYFSRLQLPQSGKARGPTFALLLFSATFIVESSSSFSYSHLTWQRLAFADSQSPWPGLHSKHYNAKKSKNHENFVLKLRKVDLIVIIFWMKD